MGMRECQDFRTKMPTDAEHKTGEVLKSPDGFMKILLKLIWLSRAWKSSECDKCHLRLG
jgi:hypothetical protein